MNHGVRNHGVRNRGVMHVRRQARNSEEIS